MSVLFLSIGNIIAQNQNPKIELTDSTGIIGPRSFYEKPSASLNNSEIIIDFSSAVPSQVVLIDQSTNQTVYSDSFASTTQVIIDLEDEGIGEGNYLLRIYAFGKWWWGEFVLEDE